MLLLSTPRKLLNYAAVSLSDNGDSPDFAPGVKATIDSTELLFGPSKIKKILGKLKEKSSGGPDDLPPIFFKKCKDILSVILSSLFQVCYNWAFMPPIWLSAIITPRYKKVIKLISKIIDRYLLLALPVR